ncbi:alpha-xylosidase [Levilactobacillus koreensis]|uniref:alpha-D-xyloside xylohydrolase n=1 Tax=Levilactobacillus koreensis TaxID=637971 RepID=A0AAC8UW10_9LACO|nr:alpha-xylosidase [Levilactobacillus koreensis]AKP64913.1 alpha-glucosidase [Levilactobacillus koreensis]
MKFTNGYWLTRDEYDVNSPAEAFEAEKDGKALNVFAPYKRIMTRGDELNLGMSTIKLTSPVENVIGVKLTHFDQDTKGPSYELNNSDPDVDIDVTEKKASLKSGDLTVTLPLREDFDMEFTANGKVLTASRNKAQGEILNHDTNVHYMREQLAVGVEDKVYGLGERFGNFIKNGQEVKITNQDGGTASEQSYKNIPFYLTDAGYGVFVDEPQTVDFEVTSENVDAVQFSTEGESLQYYVIYGPTPQEILHRYTELTGNMQLPPAWSFGLWLTTSFTTDYSEKTVLKFIDGMKERHIPLDVFHFDCFWQKGFEWSNMEWDRDEFPDPESLIKKIHDRGIKVCVWINPYIAQKGKMFEEGKKNGYFIKRENGNLWQWDLWQAGNAFVDFTNPDAVKWYKSKLQALLDMGVDCFKTDFGERIPVDDAVFFDGSDPKREHNYYTLQYNKAVFDTIAEDKGKDQAVVFARSATVGSQKYPVHWGGDALSNFKNMSDTLHAGLSFLSSGFAFWSHDIGGFEDGPDTPTPDLYKRWSQFGLLSSHSRYHGSNVYRVPWNFDDEAVENTRKFVNLKLSLMPYLYTQAAHNTAYGNPLMRPMWFDFTNDLTTHSLDNQYMFGTQLLVSPIFNKEGHVNFYLPAGKWTSIIDDSETYNVAEGKWISKDYGELDLPVLARDNTILLRNPKAVHADYDFTKDLDIHLYDMHEGSTSVAVVNQKGKDAGKVTVDRSGNQLKVTTTGLTGSATIYVHEDGKVTKAALDGANATITL